MKITVLNTKGQPTNKVFTLSKAVFESEAHKSILRQVIHVHITNTRTGTAKAKGRSEVSGTGKKPWHNNKMGIARTGDRRTPIFTGGGVSHGPVPMNYGLEIPKKMKKAALYIALTEAVAKNKLIVIEDFEISEKRKTKQAADIVANIETYTNKEAKKTMFYYRDADEAMKLAFRNIPAVALRSVSHMHAYDVVSASEIVVTESAMEVLNGEKAETVKPKKEVEVKEDVPVKKTVKKTTTKSKKAEL